MNINKIKRIVRLTVMLSLIYASFSCDASQIHIKPITISDIYPLQQLASSALRNTAISLGLIGLLASYNYVVSNYLVQEEHLVQVDYPYAQEWYQDLVCKYPAAHLDTKLFLQTMRNIPAKNISWCSSFRHIYFPQDELITIDAYYKKKMDGLELDTDEELFLAEQEFILLHEAGHIESNDAAQRYMTLAALAIGVQLAGCALQYWMQDKTVYENQRDLYQALWKNDMLSNVLYYSKIAGAFAGYTAVVRSQEFAADTFACTLADQDALQGGISFCQTRQEFDPLINIEDTKVSPFIPVSDSWGQAIQDYFKESDEESLQNLKNIKKDPQVRKYFDFFRSMTHPGSFARAERIQQEIDRRAQE